MANKTLIITQLLTSREKEILFSQKMDKEFFLLNSKNRKKYAEKPVLVLAFLFEDVENTQEDLEDLSDDLKTFSKENETVILAVHSDDYEEVVQFLQEEAITLSYYDVVLNICASLNFENACLFFETDLSKTKPQPIRLVTLFDYIDTAPKPRMKNNNVVIDGFDNLVVSQN